MLNSGLDIRQLLSVARLPAMPHVLIKLIAFCQDEDARLDDLADLISKDAAVTMRILGAANSAAPPYSGNKPGLRQSLLALGMDTVKTLLFNESVSQVFSGFTNSDNSDLRGFWRHSYTAALAAQKIAVITDYPHLEEAYLAGLLHDVGRLALLSADPKKYLMLLSHVDDAGLCEAEEQTFHITHAGAGAFLLAHLRLDSFLADSVLYHHQPVLKVVGAHPLIRIVMLADLIASHGASEPAIEAARLLFGLKTDALKNICSDIEERVKEAAVFLKIDLAGTEQAMAVLYPSKRANDDGNVRDKLVLEVQQVILASEEKRSFAHADDEAGVMSAVARSAELQFGFGSVLFLMLDEEGLCLRGVSLGTSRQVLSEFSVPVKDGGAISAAVGKRQIAYLDSESDELNIADEQLFRLLAAEQLVCIPLLAGPHNLGAIIGTTDVYRLTEIHARTNSLRTFASQAAAAIDAARIKAAESGRIAEEYRQASRWVVHEVSNPLSIIKNYLAVLDDKVKRQEPIQAEVSILSQEIDRVGEILHGFAELKMDSPREMLGVNHVVGDVLRFLQVTGFIPPSVHIDMQLHAEIDAVHVDSNALKQILVNLIKNAVEAIVKDGEIKVATPGFINRDGRLYCVLTIQDNGPGIVAPVLAKLFSPVHSDKSGVHAGLGLSIVHGLVQKLEGIIMCRSSNAGTIFEILLPVASVAGDNVDDIPQNRKSIGGSHGKD